MTEHEWSALPLEWRQWAMEKAMEKVDIATVPANRLRGVAMRIAEAMSFPPAVIVASSLEESAVTVVPQWKRDRGLA